MKRHQFMLDLLRPEITTEELTEWIGNKQELTADDFTQIIENAGKVIEAVMNHMED